MNPRQICRSGQGGFTVVEMLVVCAMLSVLAMGVMPLAEIAQQRWKERELRTALIDIRSAIDTYKRLHDQAARGRRQAGSGYPSSLQALVDGWAGLPGDPVQAAQPLLRRIPRDPFAPDSLPAAETWGLRSYASPAHAPRAGEDVYDVYSLSGKLGSNGIALREW